MHFRKIGELVPNKTAHSSFQRRQHLQFLPEQRGETHRDQQSEQRSAVGKRVWQSSALLSPTKTLKRDLAPIGDDIEPIEAPREDVEKVKDEDEETSEGRGSQSKNESEESHESRETST